MIVFIRHLKINKISVIFFSFLLVSKYAFSEQIIDQDVDITSGSTLSNASGFEYDIFHNTSALNPTGVSGLTSIDLTKNYNPTRPIITFGLNHDFSSDQTIEAKFQYQELSFKDMSETNLYINYKYSF